MVTIRRAGVAFGLVMALAAAGCSGGSARGATSGTAPVATGAAPGSPTTEVTDASLEAMLLTIADMPAGWSVDPTDSSNGTNESSGMPACLQQLDSVGSGPSDPSAEAKFVGSAAGLPAADETIGPFGPDASSTFDEASALLSSCADVSFDTGGQHISGTMATLSFPDLGDESAAWRMSFTVQGMPLSIDLALVRRGDLGVLVSAAYLGSADPRFLQTMATKALAKLPAST